MAVPRGLETQVANVTLVPLRVNDSDDLLMTESEVGKVALRIEKELFGLFQVTDNRYKSKYRSLLFNLKDPKNQVCAGPASGRRLRPALLSLSLPWHHSAPLL